MERRVAAQDAQRTTVWRGCWWIHSRVPAYVALSHCVSAAHHLYCLCHQIMAWEWAGQIIEPISMLSILLVRLYNSAFADWTRWGVHFYLGSQTQLNTSCDKSDGVVGMVSYKSALRVPLRGTSKKNSAKFFRALLFGFRLHSRHWSWFHIPYLVGCSGCRPDVTCGQCFWWEKIAIWALSKLVQLIYCVLGLRHSVCFQVWRAQVATGQINCTSAQKCSLSDGAYCPYNIPLYIIFSEKAWYYHIFSILNIAFFWTQNA